MSEITAEQAMKALNAVYLFRPHYPFEEECPEYELLRSYIHERHRPPAGEVRVVEQVVPPNTEPYRIDLPAPLDVRVSLEPGQYLAIVEPNNER